MENKLAEDLKNIPAGFLNEPIFNQIARLGVLAYLELVAFRVNNGITEVLLTKRSPSDKFWPNMYHNPGTVLRPNDSDNTFNTAFERLFADEYANSQPQAGPFFEGFWFMTLERGTGLGIINWMELNECSEGEYFAIDDLPINIIKGQADYIKRCAVFYEKYKAGNYKPKEIQQLILE